jgi:hypothetical protein
MMNYELLGTIWEHTQKKLKRGGGRGEGEILLNLEPCPLGKDITFVVSNNTC